MDTEKNCGTCVDNDDGFCDRKGILVEDDDTCDSHRSKGGMGWRERMMRVFLAGH